MCLHLAMFSYLLFKDVAWSILAIRVFSVRHKSHTFFSLVYGFTRLAMDHETVNYASFLIRLHTYVLCCAPSLCF